MAAMFSHASPIKIQPGPRYHRWIGQSKTRMAYHASNRQMLVRRKSPRETHRASEWLPIHAQSVKTTSPHTLGSIERDHSARSHACISLEFHKRSIQGSFLSMRHATCPNILKRLGVRAAVSVHRKQAWQQAWTRSGPTFPEHRWKTRGNQLRIIHSPSHRGSSHDAVWSSVRAHLEISWARSNRLALGTAQPG